MSEDSDEQLPLSDLRPCVFGENGVPAGQLTQAELSDEGSGLGRPPLQFLRLQFYADSRVLMSTQKPIFKSHTQMMKAMKCTSATFSCFPSSRSSSLCSPVSNSPLLALQVLVEYLYNTFLGLIKGAIGIISLVCIVHAFALTHPLVRKWKTKPSCQHLSCWSTVQVVGLAIIVLDSLVARVLTSTLPFPFMHSWILGIVASCSCIFLFLLFLTLLPQEFLCPFFSTRSWILSIFPGHGLVFSVLLLLFSTLLPQEFSCPFSPRILGFSALWFPGLIFPSHHCSRLSRHTSSYICFSSLHMFSDTRDCGLLLYCATVLATIVLTSNSSYIHFPPRSAEAHHDVGLGAPLTTIPQNSCWPFPDVIHRLVSLCLISPYTSHIVLSCIKDCGLCLVFVVLITSSYPPGVVTLSLLCSPRKQ